MLIQIFFQKKSIIKKLLVKISLLIVRKVPKNKLKNKDKLNKLNRN